MEMFINILIVISGICWSIVYVDSIRIGFKQKTYAMPLFALGLNIVWEGLYAFTDIFVRQSIGAQAIANACWFLLDCVIVYTYFKFGKSECRNAGFIKKSRIFMPRLWTTILLPEQPSAFSLRSRRNCTMPYTVRLSQKLL